MVRPGVRYRDIHETAARHILAGLVDLGIFRGERRWALERGAHALFFPHGVGHLLGVDVHDMEDLGDRAGYQRRSHASDARFGDRYLRLDRDLVPGMAVTIEPGFYQVPAILERPPRSPRRSRAISTAPSSGAVLGRARHPHRGRRAGHRTASPKC